ncbi:MAG: hypothetical protein H6735_10485 [Alphaproteobacteria bacterium]|nr:hypothetical protein [Alphaproteobacteria bacterium]
MIEGRPSEPLVASDLVVRRQRLEDDESDYVAVMANRAWLRRWSGSDWPEDTFTLAENRADLEGHIADHEAGEALGYTLANPAGDVLGSLYVQPLAEILDDYAASHEVRAALADAVMRADLWTRLDQEPDRLRRAVASIDPWLRAVWPGLVWCARVDCPELEQAYADHGLALVARLVNPSSGRVQLLYR